MLSPRTRQNSSPRPAGAEWDVFLHILYGGMGARRNTPQHRHVYNRAALVGRRMARFYFLKVALVLERYICVSPVDDSPGAISRTVGIAVLQDAPSYIRRSVSRSSRFMAGAPSFSKSIQGCAVAAIPRRRVR